MTEPLPITLRREGVPHSWKVGDLPVRVRRDGSGWVLLGRTGEGAAWLQRHEADRVVFATRRDAVAYCQLLMRDDPVAPEPAPAVRLVRVRAGAHRTADGMFDVVRDRSGWKITKRGSDMYTGAPTLASVRDLIAMEMNAPERFSMFSNPFTAALVDPAAAQPPAGIMSGR